MPSIVSSDNAFKLDRVSSNDWEPISAIILGQPIGSVRRWPQCRIINDIEVF